MLNMMMMRDLRYMMINLDQDTTEQVPRVMKAVAHLYKNNAGDYAAIECRGHLSAGESVSLINAMLSRRAFGVTYPLKIINATYSGRFCTSMWD